MAADASVSSGLDPLAGSRTRAPSLERVPIRTREGSATRSAWRLAVSSEEGTGAILLVEISESVSLYRGEGVFLGWPAERLEAAYRALAPQSDEPGLEFNQLG